MRAQVPQFVDIEDKIIGPLTLKQFIIYLVAVLLLVPVFLRSDLSLFLTVAVPVLGTAALFAHFRFHGKSLFVLITHVAAYYFGGQRYVWRRTGSGRPMRLGPEIVSDVLPAEEMGPGSSALQIKARQIDTEGPVVNQDEIDPLTEETGQETS